MVTGTLCGNVILHCLERRTNISEHINEVYSY